LRKKLENKNSEMIISLLLNDDGLDIRRQTLDEILPEGILMVELIPKKRARFVLVSRADGNESRESRVRPQRT
jgi:hypothetical protein